MASVTTLAIFYEVANPSSRLKSINCFRNSATSFFNCSTSLGLAAGRGVVTGMAELNPAAKAAMAGISSVA